MKPKIILCVLLMIVIFKGSVCQEKQLTSTALNNNYIEALKDTLIKISESTDNAFFRLHCNSMLAVIGSKSNFTIKDSAFLENTYHAINNQNDTSSAKALSTFIKRQRPFILSWVSPTDGVISFSWLTPPKNWNPANKYPLYIQLHGLWSVASNSIEYMTYPFLETASGSNSFEDGYLLSPWGRGNQWYHGISETDIWECIAALEDIVSIDPTRKYLSGHSMGGYGAWRIASKSPDAWAAIGIHAGALWYDGLNLVNTTVADALKNVPTYFVCGTNDNLLNINHIAYNLLEDAGNQHLKFTTFIGGHDYIEENIENMYLWMRNFVNEDLSTDLAGPMQPVPSENLIRCYPNPASTNSTIVYTGIENTTVRLSIYDGFGQLIDEITEKVNTNGENSITYNTAELLSGIYLVRIRSDKGVSDAKMIVLR